jgi:carbon-monoxide dehydrogenase small subunit
MPAISMKVNGKAVCGDVETARCWSILSGRIWVSLNPCGLRHQPVRACVVHIDGKAVKSCTTLAVAREGADVTTIEGIAKNGKLHPMQQAFHENHGLQCGFCTPGMIMASIDIVKRNGKKVSEEVIRRELSQNICRCTGYHNIVAEVQSAAEKM